MNHKYFSFASLILFLFAGFIISCNKDDEGNNDTGFDRALMLSDLGYNVIIPSYDSLKRKTNLLQESVTSFTSSPSTELLIDLRNDFKVAYRAWQYCAAFQFGPAETELLRDNLNTFPTDPDQINLNIASGSYNLETASNLDAKGFPGMDYLLFGVGNEAETVEFFATGELAEKRKVYLQDLVNEIKTKVDKVYNGWHPDGENYIQSFQNASGTDAGSSLGQLVNELNFDFEIIKNPKVGIPLGKKSLGEILPEKVEAYYSGISSELAMLNVKAIEDVYLGRAMNGTDGIGLDEYLIHLNAQHNGNSLSNAIKNQFTSIKNSLTAVPDPLSATVQNNKPVVEAAYNELQKMVVLLKSDMPSALGVLITYQDNDGD